MNLRQAPLRSKLRFVILGTCAAALLAACVVLFAVQLYFFRKDHTADVVSFTETIATRLPGPMDFDLPERGAEILSSLSVKPHFTGARVVRSDGSVFASYGAVNQDPTEQPGDAGIHTEHKGGDLIASRALFGQNGRIGTLYVVSDYATLAGRLVQLYLAIFCAVLTVSVLVALFISRKLTRVVTGPLERLAKAVRQIAGNTDYSIRVEKVADDEVGAFTDSFNQMLERIQSRDASLRHEIAERERAEKELQVLHTQLVDASRQAGMAEVATGVLHNVGNVLNSVNVSATLVAEKLGIHRLNNLARTAGMLLERNGDVGDFLQNDPKGRLIPSYLADLSRHLVSERQEAINELDLLTKNIEHIKEIVSTQQNYARVAGIVEQLSAESIVEDALRMTMGSLQRHHVEVVRDYSDCPPVTVDRHKTLQILVNLIRNAKHAMDDAAPTVKHLKICIFQPNAEHVSIRIEDNGIGIPTENLTRIFSHGFTTRKDGHGFGLHSAALAAQQMGGRMSAHSDGPGRGASFTLELPLKRPEAKA